MNTTSIIEKISDIQARPLFFLLKKFIAKTDIYLKLEGLNIAGSIKLRSAKNMIESLEKKNKITPGKSIIVCSSSGNLGIAVSILCKEKDYDCICVSDPNISPFTAKLIKSYGCNLITVKVKDKNQGYLSSRLKLIDQLLAENPNYVWLNQYNNPDNYEAHFETATQIINVLGPPDYLFIGAGTTGTLMGCAKYFKSKKLTTKIIAVDPVGSVTFDYSAGKRLIPGLGTSRKPEIVDSQYIDDLIRVNEIDTIKACHELLDQYCLFVGGSTGTLLHGIKEYANRIEPNALVVGISPDFGERYLDTVYNDEWVKTHFF